MKKFLFAILATLLIMGFNGCNVDADKMETKRTKFHMPKRKM